MKNNFETFEEKNNTCGSEQKTKTMLKQPCWISGRVAIDTKGCRKVLLEERIPALKNVYNITFKVIENTINSIAEVTNSKWLIMWLAEYAICVVIINTYTSNLPTSNLCS